jgi:hypothetical protein
MNCLYTPTYRIGDSIIQTVLEAVTTTENDLAEDLAAEEPDYPIYPENVTWTSHYQLYSMLLNGYVDSTLQNTETENFLQENENSSFGQASRAAKLLARADTLGAIVIINAMEDNLLPAQNFKTYLQCISSTDSSFTDSLKYALLLAIANQCPVNGGPAVYLAQSRLREWNDTLFFSDEYACSAANLRMAEDKGTIYYFNKEENNLKTILAITLSPNPVDNLLNIQLQLLNNQNSQIYNLKIYNELGQLIGEANIPSPAQKIVYDVSSLIDGNYLLVVTTTNTTLTSKFYVQH